MFDLNAPYATVKEPGDSSRTLLVQGDISLWLGWPPSDHFPTPAWARGPAEDTIVPENFEDRAEAAQNRIAGMKHKLQQAQQETVPAQRQPNVASEPNAPARTLDEPVMRKVEPLKKK
jgi:hypothetical protein